MKIINEAYYSADEVKRFMYWTAKMTKGYIDSGKSEIEISEQIEAKLKEGLQSSDEKIWDVVHAWCSEQAAEIPDWNRRVLMERIKNL